MPEKYYWILFCFGLLTQSESYNIGLLLSSSDSYKTELKKLAAYAVSEINNSSGTNITLIAREYNSSAKNLFDAACSLTESDVSAVIHAGSSTVAYTFGDIFTSLKIPLISTFATDPFLTNENREYLIKMSPSDRYQSEVIYDILKHFEWTEITILASADNYGLHGTLYLQNLITHNAKFKIVNLIYFETSNIETFNADVELNDIKDSLSSVIILNCDDQYGKKVLESAYKMGLMGPGFVWIVTDAITGNPKALSKNGVYMPYYDGLIGVSLHMNKHQKYTNFKYKYLNHNSDARKEDLTIFTTLTYDAVQMAHKSLSSLPFLKSPEISCGSVAGWTEGPAVLSSLKNVSYSGIIGHVNFTETGERKQATYDVVNFRDDAFQKVGHWTNESHLTMWDPVIFLGEIYDVPEVPSKSFNNQHFKLGIVIGEPFVYPPKADCKGNDCWVGICPDIVQRLANDLNFTYEYLVAEDGKFGGLNRSTGKWNGVIGDLINERIDIITTHLSTSSIRKSVMDFSYSFMDAGISAVVKKESGTKNKFFFLSPFNLDVWMSIMSMTVVISGWIWLINHLSPYTKDSEKTHAMHICPCHGCSETRAKFAKEGCSFVRTKNFHCLIDLVEHKEKKEHISLYNACWVGGSGLLNKARGILPSSISGRFVCLSWWFFMISLISMYTANLTASLTLDNMGVSLTSVKDLLSQNKYEWGVIGSTYVESLLLNNIDPTYTKIVKGGFTLDNFNIGLEEVKKGDYVFISETPLFAHHLKKDCDIVSVGSEFQTFEYAFGFPKGAPYADLTNRYISRYREEGYMDELWRKWSAGEKATCSKFNGKKRTFDIDMLSGIFCLLFINMSIGLCLVIVELIAATITDCGRDNDLAFMQALKLRLMIKKDSIFYEWSRNKLIKQTKHGSNGVELDTIKNINHA